VLQQFMPCFEVIAYCGFAGSPLAKLRVDNSPHPFLAVSADARLPVLRHASAVVPHEYIVDYLKKNFADLDAGLSVEVHAQIKAFSAIVNNELKVCLDVARFDDEEHWLKVTRPNLLAVIPWPANRPMAYLLRRQASQRISCATQLRSSHDRLEWAREKTRDGLQAICSRMSHNANWICGTLSPTSLDALVWGFLAHASGEGSLINIANEFPVLEQFYRRGLERIAKCKFVLSGGQNLFTLYAGGPFLSLREGVAPTRADRTPLPPPPPPPPPKEETEEEKSFQQARKEALVFALSAFTVYLFFFGAVQIRLTGVKRGGDDEDE